MFNVIARVWCVCVRSRSDDTPRERPIIQHKLYVYRKVGSILEGTPRTRTQSLELLPESVQRYRRRRRDRILFYYTGELMLRSYYTYVYVYVYKLYV